ncbi:SUMF1/EgtB/PvdO family nonheme iron enzyme [bacterium]|nr:SUMF1/EgtB/PvdO family nonheme iron enzyme [bacterium]
MVETEVRAVVRPGMVLVPAGPFLFGRDKQEVALSAFWIDKDPVTNREYDDYVGKTGSARPPGWPPGPLPPGIAEHPVVNVSFDEAAAYAKFLGKELATPAQWEKAGRGTDGRKFPWGSGFEPNRTNTKEAAVGRTVPVSALKDESPYGCRGMSGNVFQWTRGIYDAKKQTRVTKGGSFRNYLGALAWSYEVPPAQASDNIGFRCVEIVPGDGVARPA